MLPTHAPKPTRHGFDVCLMLVYYDVILMFGSPLDGELGSESR